MITAKRKENMLPKIIKYLIEDSNNKGNVRPVNEYSSYSDLGITETEIKAFYIIRKKSLKEFKKLNLKRPNIEYNGKYLLTEAIYYEKFEIVKYLVENRDNPVSLNIIDAYGRNIIQLALLYNKTDMASYLLESYLAKGFQLDETLKQLIKGNLKALNEEKINEQDYSGSTIMHYICAIGSLKLFQSLNIKSIVSKIEFSIKDKEGLTCIDRAAANGHVELLKELNRIINFQLNSSYINSIISSTLKYSPNADVLKWIKDELPKQNKNLLLFAVNGRTSDALLSKFEFLIEECNIDCKTNNEEGDNLLMHLAKQVEGPIDTNLFSEFVSNNESDCINMVNSVNQTAIQIAAENDNFEMFDLYREHDFDLNTKDKNNWTPIMYAIKSGYIDILDSGYIDQVLYTLLTIAIINKRNEIFKKLIDKYKIKTKLKTELKLKLPIELRDEERLKYILNIVENSENNLTDENVFVLNVFKNCSLENFEMLFDMGKTWESKQSLLNLNIDTNVKPLHLFALFGRIDAILWLCDDNRTEIITKDTNGLSALNYAFFNKQINTIFLLIMLRFNDKDLLFKIQDYFNSEIIELHKAQFDFMNQSFLSNSESFDFNCFLSKGEENKSTCLSETNVPLYLSQNNTYIHSYYIQLNGPYLAIQTFSNSKTQIDILNINTRNRVIEPLLFDFKVKFLQIQIESNDNLKGKVYAYDDDRHLHCTEFSLDSTNTLPALTFNENIIGILLLASNKILVMSSSILRVFDVVENKIIKEEPYNNDRVQFSESTLSKNTINSYDAVDRVFVVVGLDKAKKVNIYKYENNEFKLFQELADLNFSAQIQLNIDKQLSNGKRTSESNEAILRFSLNDVINKQISIIEAFDKNIYKVVAKINLNIASICKQTNIIVEGFYDNKILMKQQIGLNKVQTYFYDVLKANDELKLLFECNNVCFIDKLNEYFVCEFANKNSSINAYHEYKLCKLINQKYSVLYSFTLLPTRKFKRTDFKFTDDQFYWIGNYFELVNDQSVQMSDAIYRYDISKMEICESEIEDVEKKGSIESVPTNVKNILGLLNKKNLVIESNEKDEENQSFSISIYNIEKQKIVAEKRLNVARNNVILSNLNEFVIITDKQNLTKVILYITEDGQFDINETDLAVMSPQSIDKIKWYHHLKGVFSDNTMSIWILLYFNDFLQIVKILKENKCKPHTDDIPLNEIRLDHRYMGCLITCKYLVLWEERKNTIYYKNLTKKEQNFLSISFSGRVSKTLVIPQTDSLLVKSGSSIILVKLVEDNCVQTIIANYDSNHFDIFNENKLIVINKSFDSIDVYDFDDNGNFNIKANSINDLNMYDCHVNSRLVAVRDVTNKVSIIPFNDPSKRFSCFEEYKDNDLLKNYVLTEGYLAVVYNGTVYVKNFESNQF